MNSRDLKSFTIGVSGGLMTGKTSLCARLVDKIPQNDYLTTIGIEFNFKYCIKNKIKLYFWDLAGGEYFDQITLSYVKNVDMLLFLYNTQNYDSINRMKRLHNFYKYSGVKKIPIIIVGTHIELDSNSSNNSCNFTDFARIFASQNNYSYYEVDNKSGKNIIKLQDKIIEILMTKNEMVKPSIIYENLSCNKFFKMLLCYIKKKFKI